MKPKYPTVIGAVLVSAVSIFGQSAAAPAFSAADVHTVPSSDNAVLPGALPGTSRFELHGATMVDLIQFAWGVDGSRIAGGPNWLATNRFEVIAEAPGRVTREESAAMLRTLLADRFKLVVHNDTRPVRAYVMTVAKGGSKMKKSDGSGESGCMEQQSGIAPGDGPSTRTFACRSMSMAAFAERLPGIGAFYFSGNRLVVDLSHLEGSWDFTFHFTPPGQAGGEATTTLFQAAEKELGLHIEVASAPVPVIVVDSVNDKPTDNAPGVSEKLRIAAREFDVALLKPSEPGATQLRASLQGGKVDVQNATLRTLITVAWNLTNDKIVGLPDFADSDRYDIKAQPPAGVDSGFDSLRTMIQSLLKERFGMKLHNEDRSVDVYALVAPKPKLKKADPGNRSDCQNGINPGAVLIRSISCQNTTMEQLAAALKKMAGGYFSDRAVVDATGLEGAWDLVINFSPAGALQPAAGSAGNTSGGAAAAPEPDRTLSIFDAVDRQLGLKLETQKRPMPVLVIDHMERKPGDN